ncbi:hypothetical protein [Nostoc sp. UHCC 0251]|nr:hypothetical protein [Nostoc sp. UHCC 0251]MEA5622037.1 hypothetical protein [Nostoc sp. UHCC 0251]
MSITFSPEQKQIIQTLLATAFDFDFEKLLELVNLAPQSQRVGI